MTDILIKVEIVEGLHMEERQCENRQEEDDHLAGTSTNLYRELASDNQNEEIRKGNMAQQKGLSEALLD